MALLKTVNHIPGTALVLLLGLSLMTPLVAAPSTFEQDEDNTTKIYKKLAPATVFISSAYIPPNRMPGVKPEMGIGSGILLDQHGLILTNAHVIGGAEKIVVTLYDGSRLPAKIIGGDTLTDLALLEVQLPKGSHVVAELGDSSHLVIGQKVVAIGHPFGFGFTLTTGIISGLGDSTQDRRFFSEPIIQTTAPINPGNSGGPLAGSQGRVIGITTRILEGAQNMGFAIPINTAKKILEDLRLHGRVIRPWVGIGGTTLPDEIIELLSLPLSKGFLVENIEPGSPAEKAGLRKGHLNMTIEGQPWVIGGDIIQRINNSTIQTLEDISKVFETFRVGQTVECYVLREGLHQTIFLTLTERPNPFAPTESQPEPKVDH